MNRICRYALLVAISSSVAQHGIAEEENRATLPPVPLGVASTGVASGFLLSYTNQTEEIQPIDLVRSQCPCISVTDQPIAVLPGETILIPCEFLDDTPRIFEISMELVGDREEVLASWPVIGAVIPTDWWMDANDIPASANEAPILIDLRASAEFANQRAQNSFLMSASMILSRKELREKKILLLDDGVDPVRMSAVLLELREAGLENAYALNGGIGAWVRAGRETEGLAQSPVAAATIDMIRLRSSMAANPWQLIVAASDQGVGPEFPPGTHYLPDVREVSELLQSGAHSSSMKWLVVASSPEQYAALEATLPSSGAHNVHYLRDGQDAWISYFSHQASLSEYDGTQRHSTSSSIQPSGGSGCSSCPN